ncbi:MAG: ferrochelatase [Caulobacterales bacterium]
MSESGRVGVVLCNLGGPDSLAAVEPYLFNLFNDPAIIGVPAPIRWLIAKSISKSRRKKAQANYAKMGGASPILAETKRQAEALEALLAGRPTFAAARPKVVIAMRHWKPFAEDAAAELLAAGVSSAIVLPLYPQYSSTTTGSALAEWSSVWNRPYRAVCCYPTLEGVTRGYAESILETWRNGGAPNNVRVLFSAHGLPETIVAKGDPYQKQCEATAAAISAHLPKPWRTQLCFQSRVGPMKWIGPTTEECIEAAGADKAPVLVCPIAFVSEHVETLVDLDLDCAALAKKSGVPIYLRAPALGIREAFLHGLADLVEASLKRSCGVAVGVEKVCGGAKLCPRNSATLALA